MDLVVTLSTANAAEGSLAWALAKIVQQLTRHNEGVLVPGGLEVSATAEKFKTTETAYFKIGGVQYTKAATDNLEFSVGHVVKAEKWGAILIQIDAAGTISTKVSGAEQAFDTRAAAEAALPAPDEGNVALGHLVVQAQDSDGHGDWTANADDLTDDVAFAEFVDVEKPPAVARLVVRNYPNGQL
ncbi:MAG TPA: hypothetical protein VNZ57_14635 [Longimicrobiales bacterium]|nr:hypothetical protein [Longimicrobiales bacterium]